MRSRPPRDRAVELTAGATAPGHPTELDRPPVYPSAGETVYDDLVELLLDRGWCQGRPRRGRLTIDAAVDELLAVHDGTGADGPTLARAGRVARHLRDLAGGATLASWNDDRSRTFAEVVELLNFAALAHPDD